VKTLSCVDLFCGAGGLTHGFVKEGIPVAAGIDVDPACCYPYEANNKGAFFIERDVAQIGTAELRKLFHRKATVRILAGCAPCQPFSTYAQRYREKQTSADSRWGLLSQFARLAEEVKPELITMENVPTLVRHAVFDEFVTRLERLGYHVWHDMVNSSLYGVPQNRRRLVLLASKLGPIKLIPPTTPRPKTVRDAIKDLPKIAAGERHHDDPLHMAASLTARNLARIRASRPGGTWRDWPKSLRARCHAKATGLTYPSVYGRMRWDAPSPTMTTQCFGYGNGRFGHPEQDRAISLREAAILQSFPKDYVFIPKKTAENGVSLSTLGRLIGNAVPVNLAQAIARSIKLNLLKMS